VMVPAVFVVLLIIWTFAPQRPATPAAAATAASSTPAPATTTVRIARPAMIGPHTLELGTAITASLQTSLVRAGYSVVSADSSTTRPGFVVQTTVQQNGARSRVNVQLLRGGDSGAIVWSDQLDFRTADSFAAQDSVGARVVRALRSLSPP
jgi:hypothetical protein